MKIWTWGANTNGQLGLPYTCDQVETPQCVNLPPALASSRSLLPLKISAGPNEALLIVEESLQQNKESEESPNQNVIEINPQFKVVRSPEIKDVACGWEFSLSVKKCGKLELFGNERNNKNFQVNKNPTGTDVIVTQISAGMRHAIAIVEEPDKKCLRRLLVCGDNSKGQLGLTDKSKKVLEPVLIEIPCEEGDSPSSLRIVRCGKEFSLVLDNNGDLFGTGSTKFGVLLTPPEDTKGFDVFKRIAGRSDFPGEIKDIQCGWTHVVVLLQDGRVFSWGRRNFGQLGRSGSGAYDICPGEVTFPEKRMTSIACGTEHNLALGESGKVYSWGWNEHSNCGVLVETTQSNSSGKDELIFDNILYPKEVSFPGGTQTSKISVIGAGAGSSYAVSS